MSHKILSVGEMLWDAFPEGLFLGGAPFNVACHLHTLGCHVKMLSRIGEDILGREIVDRMHQKKMDISLIQIDSTHDTGLVKVQLNEKGIPKFKIVQPSAWDFIELNKKLEHTLVDTDVLIFGTLAQRSAKTRSTIQQIRLKVKFNVYDVNLRPPFDDREIVLESLEGNWIVKLNDDELQVLSAWFDLPQRLKNAAEELQQKFQIGMLCITQGAHGAMLFDGKHWYEHAGYKIEVVDTVGSGDGFLAGFLFKLLSGAEPDECLDFANALGAFIATRPGATPEFSEQEIEIFKKQKVRL
ncbi:MAG TPA: carbohydrate kinase [Caldithrix abyssi]|uniref:Carbohydrate kinase n=1 Tax=Caldithrix abyssi TaxID=187145 RepID=A0A7V5LIP1_CALAY|nr:carbohydrate kinase [Caldithrix abyssi]